MSKYAVSFIPTRYVDEVVPQILAYADKAATWSVADDGRYTEEDVLNEIDAGTVDLWLIYAETRRGPVGFFTTNIVTYSHTKRLALVHLAGEEGHLNSEVMAKVFEVLERFAKDAGCEGLEFVGRLGWNKFVGAHGYVKKPQATYYKDF